MRTLMPNSRRAAVWFFIKASGKSRLELYVHSKGEMTIVIPYSSAIAGS
jgi:hypothetical protein